MQGFGDRDRQAEELEPEDKQPQGEREAGDHRDRDSNLEPDQSEEVPLGEHFHAQEGSRCGEEGLQEALGSEEAELEPDSGAPERDH